MKTNAVGRPKLKDNQEHKKAVSISVYPSKVEEFLKLYPNQRLTDIVNRIIDNELKARRQ